MASKKARLTYGDLPLNDFTPFQSVCNVLFPFSFDLDEDSSGLLVKLRRDFSELQDMQRKYTTPKEVTRAISKFAAGCENDLSIYFHSVCFNSVLLLHSIGVNPVSRFNDEFLVVEAVVILLAYCRPSKAQSRVNLDTLLLEFPDFAKVDAVEQENLLKYRNMMASALEVKNKE